METDVMDPNNGMFTVNVDGVLFDEKALNGLAGESSSNRAYCCRLFRDDGRPRAYQSTLRLIAGLKPTSNAYRRLEKKVYGLGR